MNLTETAPTISPMKWQTVLEILYGNKNCKANRFDDTVALLNGSMPIKQHDCIKRC